MKHVVQTIEELGSFKRMFSLENKVALVTGAAGGIGRSTAAGMAELGARVVMMDIASSEPVLCKNAGAIRDKYHAEVLTVTGDISSEESVKECLEKAKDAFGTIHVVHNNAGVSFHPDSGDMPFDLWKKQVGINLTGSFLVARECAEIMKAHGHGGSIISTASMSGICINSGVCYSATKAAIRQMSDILAIDYAKYGIRFNSVCYGRILSGIHEKFGFDDLEAFYDKMAHTTPLGHVGTLEEAVGCVLYLATDLSALETGSTIILDGGACANRRYVNR